MTYCVAVQLDDALLFCSDSRTNAGPDQLNVYSKTHRWQRDGRYFITLLSAGNLATTQAVVHRIDEDRRNAAEQNIDHFDDIAEVASYIGRLSHEERRRFGEEPGFDPGASFIVGGQIGDREPALYMIYPEGNHIRPPRRSPYLQIGETKYGKPILDRIIRSSISADEAMRCMLVSMDSTMQSNATVGPPIELTVYLKGELRCSHYREFASGDPYLEELARQWNLKLRQAFDNLPVISLADITCDGVDG